MKLITNGERIAVLGPVSIGADTIRYPLAAAPAAIGDTVRLEADTGMHLRTDAVADWLRVYLDGATLVLTQLPEPEAPPEPTDAELAAEVRARRDQLLDATDWTQLLDAPVGGSSVEELRAYRQALRDIPEQPGFPREVAWPAAPAAVKAAPDPVDAAFDTLIGGGGNA